MLIQKWNLYIIHINTTSYDTDFLKKFKLSSPICNPGIASIDAALHPEGNEWLYYHTDEGKKDGSHIFTKTHEEHVNTMKHDI